MNRDAHEYTASLRVSSRALTLTEMTESLGAPSTGHDIGDPVSSQRPDAGARRNAMWLLESGIERTRPLDEHIEALVEVVEARREAFDAVRGSCEIDIFCGLFSGHGVQGGFTIGPELSSRLAALALPVGIDVY